MSVYRNLRSLNLQQFFLNVWQIWRMQIYKKTEQAHAFCGPQIRVDNLSQFFSRNLSLDTNLICVRVAYIQFAKTIKYCELYVHII